MLLPTRLINSRSHLMSSFIIISNHVFETIFVFKHIHPIRFHLIIFLRSLSRHFIWIFITRTFTHVYYQCWKMWSIMRNTSRPTTTYLLTLYERIGRKSIFISFTIWTFIFFFDCKCEKKNTHEREYMKITNTFLFFVSNIYLLFPLLRPKGRNQLY